MYKVLHDKSCQKDQVQMMDWFIQGVIANLGVIVLSSMPAAILWHSEPFQHRTLGSRWRSKVVLLVVAVVLVSPVLTALVSHALEAVASFYELPSAHFGFFVFGYSVVIFALILGCSHNTS